MAKKQTLSVSKYVAEKTSSIRDIRDSISRVKQNKQAFDVAYAAINIVASAAQADNSVYLSASPEAYYRWNGDIEMSVYANIQIERVTSLKEGVVPKVLELATKVGFEFDVTQDYAYEHHASRDFKAVGHFAGVRVRLVITASLAMDSEGCRRVKVGTEIQEVDKYEIVCD